MSVNPENIASREFCYKIIQEYHIENADELLKKVKELGYELKDYTTASMIYWDYSQISASHEGAATVTPSSTKIASVVEEFLFSQSTTTESPDDQKRKFSPTVATSNETGSAAHDLNIKEKQKIYDTVVTEYVEDIRHLHCIISGLVEENKLKLNSGTLETLSSYESVRLARECMSFNLSQPWNRDEFVANNQGKTLFSEEQKIASKISETLGKEISPFILTLAGLFRTGIIFKKDL
ncbi:MAG: hypothetical protein KR126chlam4_01220 [Candidatus Anoxychlamydiales bacterium]|nr:hypothetical protein [Candidatus Anoxychlamydiales bacterium]